MRPSTIPIVDANAMASAASVPSSIGSSTARARRRRSRRPRGGRGRARGRRARTGSARRAAASAGRARAPARPAAPSATRSPAASATPAGPAGRPGARPRPMLVNAATGIVEEHGAEAAHRHVERLGLEREDLGVAPLEGDVVEAFVRAALRGPARASASRGRCRDRARPRAAGGVAGRAAGAAADIDDGLARPADEPASGNRSRSATTARSYRSACSVQTSPSWPSHAAAWSVLTTSMPIGALLRAISSHREELDPPKGGSQWRSRAPVVADHDVVRHPRPPRRQAVDHLRARPADAAGPRPVLAPGREQALRRAEEARRPRAGPRHQGDDRPAPPHRLLDHRQGPAGDGRVGATTGRRPGARVRGPREALLRRARDEGGHPRHAGPRAGVERRAAPRQRRDPRATSTAREPSPSGCRGWCCAASSSRSSTSRSSDGPSGPTSVVEQWPDDLRDAEPDLDVLVAQAERNEAWQARQPAGGAD